MIAVVLVTTAALVQARADSLYGVVRPVGIMEGIPGVSVSVPGSAEVVLTDASGRYVVRGIAGDRVELRFERIGFQPLTVQVIAGAGSASVDVDLAPAAISLEPVAIYRPEPRVTSPLGDSMELGRARLTRASALRNPLVGESDALAELATAPFAAGPEELSSSLRVRGGSGDDNLVLLNGLPWRGPRPPGGGAGMLSSGAVTAVEVHTAVPPARYGGALSSVVVLQPQVGGRFSLDGAWDPAAIEQAAGTPLGSGGATLFVSGRHTYRSVWSQADETGDSPNGYGDLFGHVSLPAHRARWDFYLLRSSQRLAFPARTEPGDRDSTPAGPQNDFLANGFLGGVVWTDSTAVGGRAQARLWYSDVAGTAGWGGLNASSVLRDYGANVEVTRGGTEAGASISSVATAYHVREGTTPIRSLSAGPFVAAVFASQLWMPAARWTVSSGLRLAATSIGGVQVEPRFWSRLAIAQGSAFSLGYARLHQYVQSARNDESVIDALIGSDLPLAAGSGGIPPARSDQSSATLTLRLGSHGGVETNVYRRWLSGLALTPLATPQAFADSTIPVGRGTVWGEEATVTLAVRRLDLRLQLGLLDSRRNAGTAHYQTSDSPIRAALGLAYRLGHETVLRLATWVGSERPTTPLRDNLQLETAGVAELGELAGTPEAQAGALNRAEVPNYIRTDIGISKEWAIRHGVSRVGAALTIANLFDHRNVLAFVETPAAPQPVYLLSRTVSFRVQWHFAGS